MNLKITKARWGVDRTWCYYFKCPLCISRIAWNLDRGFVTQGGLEHVVEHHRADQKLINVKYKELK